MIDLRECSLGPIEASVDKYPPSQFLDFLLRLGKASAQTCRSFWWLSPRGLAKAHARTAAVFVDEVYACLPEHGLNLLVTSGHPHSRLNHVCDQSMHARGLR